MEHPQELLLTPSQPVLIRVLGIDCSPVHATVLGISGNAVQLWLQDSPAPRRLELDAPVRIDAPEMMLLGEILASGHGQNGRPEQGDASILTIAIRHVLRHMSELLRLRRALLGESVLAADARSGAPAPLC